MMNKSRNGSALIMALVVVMVGSSIVAIIFNVAFRHAWVGVAERAGFVDHTTVYGFVQRESARILQTNIDEGEVAVRSEYVWNNRSALADGQPLPHPVLSLNDLIVTGPTEFNVTDGVGRDRVRVTVFDMSFDPAWLDWGSMTAADLNRLPPAFRMLVGGGFGWGEDGNFDAPWSNPNDTEPNDPPLALGMFGSYLIRVELFDSTGPNAMPIRVAEEAFFQVIPPPSVP